MKVTESAIEHQGRRVGSIYTVEEIEARDVPKQDSDFLSFVGRRKDLAFINRFTLETFHNQFVKQLVGERLIGSDPG